MSLSQVVLHEAADRLYEARTNRVPSDPLVKTYPNIAERMPTVFR